jgi:hypothetical protein
VLQNHGYVPAELITHGMTKRLTMRLEPICIISKNNVEWGHKICPGAITKLLFFELSRELLHQKLNTSFTTCLCLKFQYWYFLYQGLVQKVPLLVEKIPDLGTKLFSLEILTIRI